VRVLGVARGPHRHVPSGCVFLQEAEAVSADAELAGSHIDEHSAELLGFLEVGCVRRLLEPHQLFARCRQRVVEPLCRFAGSDLVEATLDEDDGHIDAGQGVNQVGGGELGQERGLCRGDPTNGADDVCDRVVGRAEQAAQQRAELTVVARVGPDTSEVERPAGPGGELFHPGAGEGQSFPAAGSRAGCRACGQC